MKPKYTPKWFAPKENRQKVVPTCLHFTSVAEKIADYVQADRIQQICKWIRQIHICYKTSVQFCRTCWFSATIIPLFHNISIVFNHYQKISLKMINAHKNTQGPVIKSCLQKSKAQKHSTNKNTQKLQIYGSYNLVGRNNVWLAKIASDIILFHLWCEQLPN